MIIIQIHLLGFAKSEDEISKDICYRIIFDYIVIKLSSQNMYYKHLSRTQKFQTLKKWLKYPNQLHTRPIIPNQKLQ